MKRENRSEIDLSKKWLTKEELSAPTINELIIQQLNLENEAERLRDDMDAFVADAQKFQDAKEAYLEIQRTITRFEDLETFTYEHQNIRPIQFFNIFRSRKAQVEFYLA